MIRYICTTDEVAGIHRIADRGENPCPGDILMMAASHEQLRAELVRVKALARELAEDNRSHCDDSGGEFCHAVCDKECIVRRSDVAALAGESLPEPTCRWTEDIREDHWVSACGLGHWVRRSSVNRMTHCPNCGKRIDMAELLKEEAR